ncbi:hypothetical protein MKX08_008040 [Trichoderma sp. CBMAI-0020]|nr:hypothetical protein MKX08_008040 [Trichoderma sp. CBMAI-0020]
MTESKRPRRLPEQNCDRPDQVPSSSKYRRCPWKWVGPRLRTNWTQPRRYGRPSREPEGSACRIAIAGENAV